MISDAIALYELITKKYKDIKIISAMFDFEGNRLYGDKNIVVVKNSYKDAPKDKAWFYSIEKYKDYVFIRIPVNPGCVIESPAMHDRPDANFFRYIKAPDGFIRNAGYWPNVRTDFMVVGYQPKELLNLVKGSL